MRLGVAAAELTEANDREDEERDYGQSEYHAEIRPAFNSSNGAPG